MKIILTNHFKERCEQRYEKELNYIKNTFEYLIKKVKKNKLFPRRGNEEGTWIINYDDMKFVYSKIAGDYYLITFGKRDRNYIIY